MNSTTTLTTGKFSKAAKPTCYHCGEDCTDAPILFHEKSFCCEGCKMVFEILNGKDLCQYYELEAQPGVSLKGKSQKEYAWLDDEKVQQELIQFQQDEMTKVTFYLPQIHCASCIWLLENLYRFNEGILFSKVNFLKKEIQLHFNNHQISLRQIAELLASIGYAPEINLGDLEPTKKTKVDKRLIYQLGVTGFAFGNIMLLSFPEYLGLNEINTIGFATGLGYLNILLTLPVVFFGGKDYLKSAWISLQKRHLNIDVPIALGMLTLFGRSVFEIVTATGAGYLDALAGLVFFLLIGKWFQQATYNRLSFERDYKSYFPVAALLKNGTSVPLFDLMPGDIIVVKNKELIPADGILLSGKAFIDYSFVTGESDPVPKTINEQLYAGGQQIGSQLLIQINKSVSQSYLTQLWNDSIFSKTEKMNTQLLADRVGKYFTYSILTIALITLLYWLQFDVGTAVNAFTAVLIIACPCAVALSVPFTFGNALRILGKRGFYLKNTQVIEQLQQVTAVVFDKTGTLTAISKNDQISFEGPPLEKVEQEAVARLAAQSGHPLSRQILSFLGPADTTELEVLHFKELEGKGIQATVQYPFGNSKGHLQIKLGSAAFTQNQSGTSGPTNHKHSKVFLTINGIQRGHFHIKNNYREGLEEVIHFFKNQFNLHLLSGDHDATQTQLAPLFGDQLHYNKSPKDKLEFIKSLQENGEKVLMIGDGLNDAGALAQSDVGIVITEDANNFTPASDAIMDASVFIQLPWLLQYTRGCLRLVYVAYGVAFIYNIIGLSFAVQAQLSPVIAAILMPLSSITIILLGVLSGTFLASYLKEETDKIMEPNKPQLMR